MNKPFPTILIVLRSAQYFHYFRSVMEALIAEGYKLRLLFDRDWNRDVTLDPVEELQKIHPEKFEYGWAVAPARVLPGITLAVRSLRAYRRYLRLEGQSSFYRKRWEAYLPKTVKILLRLPGFSRLIASEFCGALLRFAERIIPPDRKSAKHIQDIAPAVVLIAPGTMLMPSADTDYLKAAKRFGVPVAALALSWDNLSTKGVIPVVPDRFLVWNELQQEEAINQHDVPRGNTRVIGAPVFDNWFTYHYRGPTSIVGLSRSDLFLENLGIHPGQPILLYLGSSKVGDESWIVRELRKSLDASLDPLLCSVHIIIRPHPGNADIFESMNIPGISVVPKGGELPRTEESFRLFADSLAHSFAAIGVTTSAFIEAAIMRKPTILFFGDKFAGPLRVTAHQRNFLRAGVIRAVEKIDEAVREISSILHEGVKEDFAKAREEFLSQYIRPSGLEITAGRAAADEIKEMLGAGESAEEPLVSIGLAVYNGERVIRRAIDSLLSQTYKNIELIISDDCSTDSTYEIAKEYAERDKRIRCIRQPLNGGYVNNFYAAFRASRGKYFMWAAQDDRWAPECIEKLVQGLEAHPERGIALSSFERVYEDGPVEETVLMEGEYDFTGQSPYEIYRKLLMRKRYIPHFMYGLIRRDFLEKLLQNPLTEQKAWDIIIVSEMALATRFLSVKPILRFSSNKRIKEIKGDAFYEPPTAPKGAPWIKIPRFFVNTYTHVFAGVLGRVINSRVVPLRRKIGAFIAVFPAGFLVRAKLWGSFLEDWRHFLKLCHHYKHNEEFKRYSKTP